MRYIVAGAGFLLVWGLVAVLVGLVMLILFPPPQGAAFVGIATDWRNLPGTLLGLLAGWHSARASLKVSE